MNSSWTAKRSILLATLLAGWALATACGDSPVATRDIAITDEAPVITAQRDESAQFQAPVDFSLQLYEGPVEILRSVRVGDTAFVLLSVRDGGAVLRGMGWLNRKGSKWIAHAVSVDAAFPAADLPESGSGEAALANIDGGGELAFVGYTDPSITRVEVVAQSGELIDADAPLNGATLVISHPSASELRLFRDGAFVRSIPIHSQ